MKKNDERGYIYIYLPHSHYSKTISYNDDESPRSRKSKFDQDTELHLEKMVAGLQLYEHHEWMETRHIPFLPHLIFLLSVPSHLQLQSHIFPLRVV